MLKVRKIISDKICPPCREKNKEKYSQSFSISHSGQDSQGWLRHGRFTGFLAITPSCWHLAPQSLKGRSQHLIVEICAWRFAWCVGNWCFTDFLCCIEHRASMAAPDWAKLLGTRDDPQNLETAVPCHPSCVALLALGWINATSSSKSPALISGKSQ